MKPIIRVENLSKRYVLGTKTEPYSTFRESLVRAARKPLDRIRGASNSNEKSAFWALKDVGFDIAPGEVVGIIGRNGAGKSTLLKVLSRITEPTLGRIELYGRVGSLLEVGTGFHPELTGRENIFLNGSILGMRRDEISKRFDEIVDFAEVEEFLDTPVKRYSSGMYVRLAFAVAAHLEPEILIIDEVLAVGDAEFQRKCLGKMGSVAQSGRTVLFVSHNMGAVSNLCRNTILLESGSVLFSGGTRSALEIYLSRGSSSSYTSLDEAVRYATIRQDGSRLILEVKFVLPEATLSPCLGFVVCDPSGYPLFGTNPKFDRAVPLDAAVSEGQVTVSITQPGLVNGSYTLSIWFGDGRKDYFVAESCVAFEVVGMAPTQQERPNMNGYVIPECEWHFN